VQINMTYLGNTSQHVTMLQGNYCLLSRARLDNESRLSLPRGNLMQILHNRNLVFYELLTKTIMVKLVFR